MKPITWPIIGQTKAINFFEKLLAYEQTTPGALGGTYIMSGPTGSGKATLLGHFLKIFGEISETITEVYEVATLGLLPEKKEISVSQARDFNRRLTLSSFGRGYRIGVITDAEHLSTEAANALLKTLEEARVGVMVFLLTSSAERLPATIRSRGQITYFFPVSSGSIYEWLVETHHINRSKAKDASRLAIGQPGRALQLATEKKIIEETLVPMKVFSQAFSVSLAERWQESEKLLKSQKGVSAAHEAERILQIWRLGVRDLRLLQLQQPALVIYAPLEQELATVSKRLSIKEVQRLDDLIEQALIYVRANVGPKLVLEHVLMNLP